MSDTAYEVNFDGIVGPTHHYGGLAYGNLASMGSRFDVSNPRAAVLEGLTKMKRLMELGVKQAVLPPQERPDFATLRRLGYHGRESDVLARMAKEAPDLLAACWSASSMWAANAATVSPSGDTDDRRVHFTPANLVSQFHRSLEPPLTGEVLRRIFPDETRFAHHEPVPPSLAFGDEGAANHTRLCRSYERPGIELFVYGRRGLNLQQRHPATFPARQTREASDAVARLHGLYPTRVVFARQNPGVIDAGVFHNDVIAVGNRNVFLYHDAAFADTKTVVRNLKQAYAGGCQDELTLVEISSNRLTVAEAVATYLFNSQLVSLADGSMCLVAPAECRDRVRVQEVVHEILAGPNPIRSAVYVEVRQSMKNGGGPACLRLRVVLTEEELSRSHSGVFLTDELFAELWEWANRHYRDRLTFSDLADPRLVDETRSALDALTGILGLGSLYAFQRNR
jgi:succinylarginine dihydrolase